MFIYEHWGWWHAVCGTWVPWWWTTRRLVGGEDWLTLLLKRGFQPYARNAINARFMQATQNPTHASNLTQAISRFNCSVHTHCFIVWQRTATQLCPLTTTVSNKLASAVSCTNLRRLTVPYVNIHWPARPRVCIDVPVRRQTQAGNHA